MLGEKVGVFEGFVDGNADGAVVGFEVAGAEVAIDVGSEVVRMCGIPVGDCEGVVDGISKHGFLWSFQ